MPRANVHILLATRLILVVLFLLAALVTLFTVGVAKLEALLLGAGVIVCVLAGIERGFLDAASVLSARFQTHPAAGRIPVYEAAGVVIGATLSSGLLLAISAQFGVAVCFAVTGGLIALLTVPVFAGTVSITDEMLGRDPIAGTAVGKRGAPGGPIRRGRPGGLQLVSALLTLTLGWLGIDLAYRVAQPLLLRQGVPLAWVGVATSGAGIVLLLCFGAAQILARYHNTDRWRSEWTSRVLPMAAVALLCLASATDRPALTVIGLLSLQAGYFFFSVFVTDLAIRYGSTFGSAEPTVFISGASYVLAHFSLCRAASLVPLLYWTTSCCGGFTVTCLVALTLLVLCVIRMLLVPFSRAAG